MKHLEVYKNGVVIYGTGAGKPLTKIEQVVEKAGRGCEEVEELKGELESFIILLDKRLEEYKRDLSFYHKRGDRASEDYKELRKMVEWCEYFKSETKEVLNDNEVDERDLIFDNAIKAIDFRAD